MEEADNRKRVTICDLDGTLLTTNSFTQFVTWIVAKNFIFALPVLFVVAIRKLRFISHAKAKRLIIAIAGVRIPRQHIRRWVDYILSNYLNEEVMKVLKESSKAGELLLMATAAPRIYATIIGERLKFDYVLATPDAGPENCCEEKARRVKDWCLTHNARPVLFLTDHPDDLPTERYVRLSGGSIRHIQFPG